jgi:hypothetical protein
LANAVRPPSIFRPAKAIWKKAGEIKTIMQPQRFAPSPKEIEFVKQME